MLYGIREAPIKKGAARQRFWASPWKFCPRLFCSSGTLRLFCGSTSASGKVLSKARLLFTLSHTFCQEARKNLNFHSNYENVIWLPCIGSIVYISQLKVSWAYNRKDRSNFCMISSPNWPAPPLPSNKPPTILFTWGNFSEPSHDDQFKSWSLLGWLVLEVFMAESGLLSPLWHLVWSPPPPPPPSLPPPPQTLLRNNGRCWGGWECPNLPFNGTNQFPALNFYLLISISRFLSFLSSLSLCGPQCPKMPFGRMNRFPPSSCHCHSMQNHSWILACTKLTLLDKTLQQLPRPQNSRWTSLFALLIHLPANSPNLDFCHFSPFSS